jgi:hypothetical protein
LVTTQLQAHLVNIQTKGNEMRLSWFLIASTILLGCANQELIRQELARDEQTRLVKMRTDQKTGDIVLRGVDHSFHGLTTLERATVKGDLRLTPTHFRFVAKEMKRNIPYTSITNITFLQAKSGAARALLWGSLANTSGDEFKDWIVLSLAESKEVQFNVSKSGMTFLKPLLEERTGLTVVERDWGKSSNN